MCITYNMPHVLHGVQAQITFGLADEAVANTLVGLPFMRKVRMVYDAANDTVISGAFGMAYPIKLKVPLKLAAPPTTT